MMNVYNVVKQYYPFYFSENSGIYFHTDEFRKLFQIVNNKYTNDFYKREFQDFVAILKNKYPESDIFEIKNNRPSHTIRIDYFYDVPPYSDITIYISISLLLKAYVLFIDCKSSYIGKCTFAEPRFEMSNLFTELDKSIEDSFADYSFFYPSFLMSNFLNLTVPGYTKTSRANGMLTKKSNFLNALFFEYDNFEASGNFKQDQNLLRIPAIDQHLYGEYLSVMINAKQEEVPK